MATARKSALGKGLGKGLDSLITDKVGMNKQPFWSTSIKSNQTVNSQEKILTRMHC